ncbi:MAG: DUF2157 domain-containing protein [Gammaproteobacteria bacterium]|nr:DUF2157 domain-containing protein [Gammaproteobacteria bacterium]
MQLPENIDKNKSFIEQISVSLELSPEQSEKAFSVIGALPSEAQWIQWLKIISLTLGWGIFLSGVIFFFAYNWEDLHRFTRFSILSVAIIASSLLSFRYNLDNLQGKLSLTAASILTGVLLATFGMVYQTGADSWQLFASWSALILPWVIIARFQPLWLLWLLIANFALTRWAGVTMTGGWHYFSYRDVMIFPIVFNTIFLILNEKTSFLDQLKEKTNIISLVLVGYTLFMLTLVPLEVIFDSTPRKYWQVLLIAYLIFIPFISYYYYQIKQDILMIIMAMISLIVVFTSILIEILPVEGFNLGFLFVVGLFLIAQVTAATKLLKYILNHWQSMTEFENQENENG